MLNRISSWLDETDGLAMDHHGLSVLAEIKADGTPVTQADRAIERRLRERIRSSFLDDVIVGEEEGGALPDSGVAWIIDPIDGTKNFARGIPVFATLVARWEDGQLTHAAVSAPALGHRWTADESGAFLDGRPIRVEDRASLEEADLCTGGLDFAESHAPNLGSILNKVRRHRGFGDFWGYCLLAQGSVDAMLEFAPLALYDIAAPRFIVEQAGGVVSDLTGDRALKPGPALAAGPRLHAEILAALDD
ncbi:MAG: inositol monophosphatase family protein [Actinomycetota bacterium]